MCFYRKVAPPERAGRGLKLSVWRWAVRAEIRTYAAPTELDRAFGAVVAINMALLTELT